MSIYDFDDYKAYVRDWIQSQPKKGRGILRRMGEHLNMSSTMLSHVFQSDKHLSVEAATDLADFMGLAEDEFDFLLLLVLYGRAGSFALRERLKKKIKAEQKKASHVAKRMKADVELPETAKALFYSSWVYAGVRNMSACPSFKNIDAIAQHLRLPRPQVQRVVDFLVHNNLCVIKNGELNVGPQQTHIAADSAFVSKHHQNWRLQGLSKMSESSERNLFFTSPMSLSRETAEEVRPKILSFIEEIRKLIRPSPSEIVRCLNIDWFEY